MSTKIASLLVVATAVGYPALSAARPFRVSQIPSAPASCNTCHTNGTHGIVMETSANTVIKNYVKFNGGFAIALGPPTGAAVALPAAGAGGIAPFVLPSAAVPLNPFGNFMF